MFACVCVCAMFVCVFACFELIIDNGLASDPEAHQYCLDWLQ